MRWRTGSGSASGQGTYEKALYLSEGVTHVSYRPLHILVQLHILLSLLLVLFGGGSAPLYSSSASFSADGLACGGCFCRACLSPPAMHCLCFGVICCECLLSSLEFGVRVQLAFLNGIFEQVNFHRVLGMVNFTLRVLLNCAVNGSASVVKDILLGDKPILFEVFKFV